MLENVIVSICLPSGFSMRRHPEDSDDVILLVPKALLDECCRSCWQLQDSSTLFKGKKEKIKRSGML